MSNELVQPYLFFGGRCDEALEFYKKAINAQVEMVMRFNESPEAVPEGLLQEGFHEKVMHCSFRVGETTIMASDGCKEDRGFKGFSLALSVKSEAEADLVFAGLADGGTVTMPLVKTFWSPRYGMLTDRFGVEWMVMVRT